jgi:ZIP family zinc transporter
MRQSSSLAVAVCCSLLVHVKASNMVDNENVELAFGLVCAAGMATSIGAAVVFWPGAVDRFDHIMLARCLALAAGVMLYVSFIEIFKKSGDAFAEAGHAANDAYMYGTLTFFSGFVVMAGLDKLVHWIDPHHSHDDPLARPSEQATGGAVTASKLEHRLEASEDSPPTTTEPTTPPDLEEGAGDGAAAAVPTDQESKLHRMGLMTALAIAIHNFPEVRR